MKLTFCIFSKANIPFLKQAYDEYLKRLSKYGKASVEYLDEVSVDSTSKILIEKGLDQEAKKILSRINDDDYLFLIDLHGKQIDSLEFAKQLEIGKNKSSNLVFVIGSSNGLSNLLRKRANYSLSLSKLTTTHPLALLFILEQVYRGFKILNNETYHK